MGGTSHPATAEQLSGIEHSPCWRRDNVVFRVITHLREAIGENECMGHFDLPEDLRADRNIGLERVNKAAYSMQLLFKSK